MGRIERQKRQLIEEANKRVLGIIKEDDGIEDIIDDVVDIGGMQVNIEGKILDVQDKLDAYLDTKEDPFPGEEEIHDANGYLYSAERGVEDVEDGINKALDSLDGYQEMLNKKYEDNEKDNDKDDEWKKENDRNREEWMDKHLRSDKGMGGL
jgi:hypothetical protein